MKSFLRAAAATGVAAATIATGLSLAPAATAAERDAAVTYAPLYFKQGSSWYAATAEKTVHFPLDFVWHAYGTKAEARSAADQFSVPAKGQAGQIRLKGSDQCLEFSNTRFVTCSNARLQLFVVDRLDASLSYAASPTQKMFAWTDRTDHIIEFGERSNPAILPAEWTHGLTAAVADVDIEAGTATLQDGVAPSNATDVDITYTDKDGKPQTLAANVSDGTWTKQLKNLALGETTVHLEAFDGGESIAENDVTVDLHVTPLVAEGHFDEDVTEVATIVGTATRNTEVAAYRGGKKVQTVMSDGDGNFTLPINPLNMPGTYDLQVAQTIRGEQATPVEVTLDYGAGVTITSPGPDFTLEPGDDLVLRGTAQHPSKVKVYEAGKPTEPLAEVTAGTSNTYRAVIDGLEDREYKLVVEAVSKGYNRTTAEITINAGKSTVADPTAQVVFDEDVSKKATVEGTAVKGSTITVKNGDDVLGTVDRVPESGAWSLPIDPIGPGQHTLTVEQTGIDGVQTTQTTADFGEAISLNAPTSFTGGKMTVTGKSSQSAQVAIVTGGKQVDSFTVNAADGSFSRDLTGLGAGKIELHATAESKGGLTTETTASSTAPVTAESVQIGSHVKNGTFTPGEQLFTGRGTVGATITLNVHGFSSATAPQDLTAKVDQFGEWSIKRALANTTYPRFSVKQGPAQPGVTNELLNWNLRPYDEIGQPGDLQLTNFKDGDFFNPGDQTFAGKATPGATIVFNPFGLDNPAVEQYSITTKADVKTGDWTIRRAFSNTHYDRIGVHQEPAADGKVNQIDNIRIAPYGWVGTPADLTVTSHADGTFTPGMQTFTGTATPGTKVTLYAWGDNPANPATAVADARGKWSIDRILSAPPTTYNVKIVQEDAGDKTSTVYVPLTLEQ